MKSFKWDSHFETNIYEVDEQHKILVDLINRLSKFLTTNTTTESDIQHIVNELLEYTTYHFKQEESLMFDAGIDKRHFKVHIQNHKDFVDEAVRMSKSISTVLNQDSKDALDFLTHWLTYHILGIDQNMAKQIQAIQSGTSPKDAYEQEERNRHSSSTEPLLVALNGLFHHVSVKNKELSELNKSLEEKVEQRTKELVKANMELELLSLTDTLTGLPNRRFGMQTLDLLWQESQLHKKPIVCMMIDADKFKVINDTYGHDAGDDVLIRLTSKLTHNIRTDDTVCRLGGDEFLVICPNTDLEGGLYFAEQLRKMVADMKVPVGENGFWYGSVSIGVAVKTAEMKNFEELVKMSDRGVYLSKEAGKNCVRTVQNENL